MENKPEHQKKRERRLRNSRYIYEDFVDASKKLKTLGVAYTLIGLIYGGTVLVLQADSLFHALISIIVGGLFFFLAGLVDWHRRFHILAGLVIGLVLIAAEFMLLGYPDRLVPGFGEFRGRKFINIGTILNDFSPIFYFVLKLGLLYPFVLMLNQYKKVQQIPEEVKKALRINIK